MFGALDGKQGPHQLERNEWVSFDSVNNSRQWDLDGRKGMWCREGEGTVRWGEYKQRGSSLVLHLFSGAMWSSTFLSWLSVVMGVLTRWGMGARGAAGQELPGRACLRLTSVESSKSWGCLPIIPPPILVTVSISLSPSSSVTQWLTSLSVAFIPNSVCSCLFRLLSMGMWCSQLLGISDPSVLTAAPGQQQGRSCQHIFVKGQIYLLD